MGPVYLLQLFLKADLLRPGSRKLSCLAAGEELYADLGRNGEIFHDGLVFTTPLSFSLYARRGQNQPPHRGDDGLGSVKYEGKTLLELRQSSGLAGTPRGYGQTCRQSWAKSRSNGRNAKRPRSAERAEGSGPRVKVARAAGRGGAIGGSAAGRGSRSLLLSTTSSDDDPVVSHGAGGEERETWAMCDRCNRWRRLQSATPDSPWYCSMNPDARFASCDVPQELSDEAIDQSLADAPLRHYAASSKRLPLSACNSKQFETDLCRFLRACGEESKARQIRQKRIQCNNRPLDICGLYREVMRVGGFIANQEYDGYGRWIGGINFAGHIFPKMKNYTKGNRATSVGNQLLNNYRKFLFDYERAWRHIDIKEMNPEQKTLVKCALSSAANPVEQGELRERQVTGQNQAAGDDSCTGPGPDATVHGVGNGSSVKTPNSASGTGVNGSAHVSQGSGNRSIS
ncbi:unnamed protein product [Ostreobium quekettii]|uniref:CW-type domain-containing protein n=1 Tax=Ostreobium quekettii TaxID=121088 RepID=A0A8S1IYC9_9CHLO|nr:unnamed protein product [Ostreobium quekettii]